MTAGSRDTITNVCIILGSLICLVWIIPAYTPAYPGYGVPGSLVPNVSVSIILILSIVLLARNLSARFFSQSRALKEKSQKNISMADRVHLWQLIRFMIPCILLMPAMKLIGFVPAGILFMLAIQFFCGQRKPLTLTLVAVLPVCLIYAAMRFGLGVPMP